MGKRCLPGSTGILDTLRWCFQGMPHSRRHCTCQQVLVQAQAQVLARAREVEAQAPEALASALVEAQARALVEAQARARALELTPLEEGMRNRRAPAHFDLEVSRGLPCCPLSHCRRPGSAAQGRTRQWMPNGGTGSNSSPGLCRSRLGMSQSNAAMQRAYDSLQG